jgi:aspartyl-tRNA(Asn)/glutamyl-tRNA(Gln) amidotransferase subunit C
VLTPEEVRHVAMLARLGLTDDEVDTMRAQLVQVLDYIAMLEKLDTSQIPPTAQILSHLNVARPDVARPSWPADALLANAPAREGDLVRVPAVLEEFKGSKGDGVESEAGDA